LLTVLTKSVVQSLLPISSINHSWFKL